MNLSVKLNEVMYTLTYTENFQNKLEQMNGNFNNVIADLELAGEEIASTPVGESFFIVGNFASYEGVREEDGINLRRLISSGNLL